MNYYIDIQHATTDVIPISDDTLKEWAHRVLPLHYQSAELTLRLVGVEEITHLNHTYRKKNKATNVLAFPADYPTHIQLDYPLLGDVILCPTVLMQESIMLERPLVAHWAHIVIHGILHLLGYDHIKSLDEVRMQAVEINLLAELGFDNPYETEAN